MAKRRRSTATGPNKRRRPTKNEPSGSQSPEPEESAIVPEAEGEEEEEDCPECKHNDHQLNAAEKESWIECGSCKTWYHWRCAGNGGDLESIDKWYVHACLWPETLLMLLRQVLLVMYCTRSNSACYYTQSSCSQVR